MPTEKSYTRLGFFIVVTVVLVLATAVFFIQQLKSRESIAMVTYTNENVFGLDVSSAVRLRGVPVGRVTEIRADPMGKMVEIDFELFLDRLSTIGLDVDRLRKVGGMSPNLRAQVMGNPMTGQAYLLLTRMENPPPPMQLNFKPTRIYIPSAPSPFATVEERLPQLLDRADATFQILSDVVARMPHTLERGDRFFTHVERIMHESQLPALSADSRKFFATTSAQMEKIRSEMDAVMGTDGTLIKFSEEARAAIKAADLPATTQSAREAANNSKLAADDIRHALPAIQNSLEYLRELSQTLEEHPESMVYGRKPPAEKQR